MVCTDDYERLLVTSLPLIERLSRFFCRESRMTAEDIDDFIGNVRVHLMENDYAALRRFEGRCSLQTFLALVIQHLLFDYRAQHWGRFRTSAHAQRLGPDAVRLETLLRRDGMSVAEAVAVLRGEGRAMTLEDAARIERELPERRRRAVDVELDEAMDIAVDAESVEEPVVASERRETSERISDAMRAAMDELPVEDRTILRLHYVAGMSVADIARSMGLVQRQLYRRIPRICATLRERLESEGIEETNIASLLGNREVELEFGLRDVEKRPAGSSTGMEGQLNR